MKDKAAMEQRPDSVVWIDERRAIVAQLDPTGEISTIEIRRLQQAESQYLGHVVHEIGGHQHVLVVGPEPIRLALERRFVAVGHRPDRLIAAPTDARSAGPRAFEAIEPVAA